ncbi:PAS domain S-box protein [Halorarius litoreus]|uniref:PAS domain S-box protein n=1 Tax=Halorarius litoreus TaxID=2962676 RepID=UPI0020CCBBE2|nr:PAS domain S-box protein [Halorarius litoreus]
MNVSPLQRRDTGEPILVLHVDDEPDLALVTASQLTMVDDRFDTETATSVAEALDLLASRSFDCIVSDYDMPGRNGLQFLDAVRATDPDLPFILFTGKGSEEVASDAITAGVTDYLQKESGTSHYTLLANRIINAVEQHRAQQALEDSEKRLSLFIEQSPLGVIEFDPEFRIVRLNPAGEEILGYSEAELQGETWEKIVTSDSYDSVDAVTDALSEARGGYHSVNENLRKDGTRIVVEWHNRLVTDEANEVVAVFSQFQDITERQEHERELEVMRRRLDAILENTTTPMFMKDREGRYIFVNQGHRTLFGIEDADIVGRTDHELFPQTMADEVWANDRAVLDSGEPVETEEHVIVDGEQRTFLSTKVPIYDTGEEHDPERPVAVFGVATDVTQLKRREAELQHERDRLDEFAGVLSHDLRNPLSIATGRLELAREDHDSEHLAAVAQAHDRMETLVEDLLRIARKGDRSATETVVLASVVDDCWDAAVTTQATLSCATDQTVIADRGRLQQLFENLFRNAVEHGSTGTRGTSRGDGSVDGGESVTVTVGDTPDGFYVEDDGPGVPVEERDRVFETGYSTTETGTGLGLAIVRQIADAHGWSVRVTESDSGGARFEFGGVR